MLKNFNIYGKKASQWLNHFCDKKLKVPKLKQKEKLQNYTDLFFEPETDKTLILQEKKRKRFRH